MLIGGLVIAAIGCSFLAIRARRLIESALWLAGTSAIVSIIFYLMGAQQVAVIELSVGAGLVTILFVFAISVAAEETGRQQPVVPKALAWALVIGAAALLGWLSLPLGPAAQPAAEGGFSTMLWQRRGLDVLVQVVLIFAGVLGLLGLLAEAKAPLEKSVAEEIAVARDRELLDMEQRSLEREKEIV